MLPEERFVHRTKKCQFRTIVPVIKENNDVLEVFRNSVGQPVNLSGWQIAHFRWVSGISK